MPKPFVYRLDKVLDYKRRLEDEAKLAFAGVKRRHKAWVDWVEDLERALQNHDQALYADKELTVEGMWLWRMYKHRLQEDLMMAQAKAASLAEELAAARDVLIERSKERKILEKLKANQKIRHDKEENLKEQREFDETATIRYVHGNNQVY